MTKNKNYLKVLSLFGAIGAVFYFLHVLLGTLFYEGYNFFAQAISDLTATNSPSRNIAMPLSVVYGIFTVLFSIVFFAYFKGKINKWITFGAGTFCLMTIVSFLGYTFFPLSEAGYAGTFQDEMHAAVTVAVVALTVVSIVLFSIGFFQTKNLKYLGIISVCTFVLLLTGAMLLNLLPKEYFGAAERINVFSTVLYIGILSVWMNGYIRKYDKEMAKMHYR